VAPPALGCLPRACDPPPSAKQAREKAAPGTTTAREVKLAPPHIRRSNHKCNPSHTDKEPPHTKSTPIGGLSDFPTRTRLDSHTAFLYLNQRRLALNWGECYQAPIP